MLDTNEILELEKKWEIYDKNRRFALLKRADKRFIFAILSLFCLLIGVFYWISLSKTTPKDEIASLKEQIKNTQKQYEKDEFHPNTTQNDQNSSSTPQGWLFFNEIPSQAEQKQEPLRDEPVSDYEENQNEKPTKTGEQKLQISDISISGSESKEQTDNANDIGVALSMAKKFFDKKDYKNSEKWALKANELDSENEESWIIFARSKFRQNQKSEAIKILQTYNETAKSPTVDEWIKKMR